MCQDKFCLCKCFVMARAWKLLLLDSQRFRAEILMAAPCRYLGLVSIKFRSNEMNQVHELWEVILQKHDDTNSQQSCWESGMYVWNLNYTQLETCRWQILPPVNTYIEHPPFLDHFPNGNHTFCFCYLMVHLSLPATRRSDARKLQGDWRTTSGGNAVNLKQPSALNMSQYWDMVYWDIII